MSREGQRDTCRAHGEERGGGWGEGGRRKGERDEAFVLASVPPRQLLARPGSDLFPAIPCDQGLQGQHGVTLLHDRGAGPGS